VDKGRKSSTKVYGNIRKSQNFSENKSICISIIRDSFNKQKMIIFTALSKLNLAGLIRTSYAA